MSQTPIRTPEEAAYLRDLLDPRPYGVKPLGCHSTLIILQAHSCGWTNHGSLTGAGKRALWDWNILEGYPQGSDWMELTSAPAEATIPPPCHAPAYPAVDTSSSSPQTVRQALDMLRAPMVGRAPQRS